MSRFLVAWEFGEDLGHVRRILPLGRALRERGHEVAFAFRDATRLAAPARESFAAWAAPVLRRPPAFDPAPRNAADVLLNLGFRDVASLRGVQRAWDALLEVVRPDAVIGDYAPNAMIAASRHALPRATVGSGFALPPARDPLPAIRPGERADEAVLRGLDDALTASVSAAVGKTPQITLEHIFRGDANLLATWPELDPLGPRDADYLGPMGGTEGGMETAWNGAGAPRVLAYLKPRDTRFAAVLAALEASGAQAIVAAPGMHEQDAKDRSSARVRIFPCTLRLPPLLREADLCVGHGGPGFAADALRAGVPLLLLPMHLEQELVARRLAQAGLAVLQLSRAPEELAAALAGALDDEALHARAHGFARELATRSTADPAQAAAARIEALVR